MEVNSKEICIDHEDEYLTTIILLNILDDKWCLPKWAYLQREWNEYVLERSRLKNKLRKIQALL